MAEFSPTVLALFDREVAKYPADQKQSAVMACLTIVQREQGFVSADSEKAVAAYLGMAPIAVHEITTFYNMYNQQPVGKCGQIKSNQSDSIFAQQWRQFYW